MFPLTVKFNTGARRQSHAMVIGVEEELVSDTGEKKRGRNDRDKTGNTRLILAENSYGGSSKRISVPHKIEDVLSFFAQQIKEEKSVMDLTTLSKGPEAGP